MLDIEKFIQSEILGHYFEEKLPMDRDAARERIKLIEKKIEELPDARYGDDCAPLRHVFGDGLYIREITMPKGMIITSKIHKYEHPFFVMTGECTIMTDEKLIRIKAPYWGITKPGTKRVLYMHEETVWATVHATELKDPKEIVEQISVLDFSELEEEICL